MSWSFRLCLITLFLGGLVSCRTTAPAPTPPTVPAPPPEATAPPPPPTPKPTSTASPAPATPQAEADAVIQQITEMPVWVKPVNTGQENPGQEGMGMATGDTIRTEDQALAEVDLKSGLSFRIGGDAVLTLQANNRLELESGQMITWVNPGQKVPTEIVTPAGIAGLRGTTLFVNIPTEANGEVEFFAWEGTITVRPPGASEDLVIRSGEQIRIRPGERDVAQLRRRVRRLNRLEIRQRRRQNRLLNDFRRPLPTLRQIDAALETPPQ